MKKLKDFPMFLHAIENPVKRNSNTDFQVIKTRIYHDDEKEAMERHREEIFGALVYSRHNKFASAVYGHEMYEMNGFEDRTGRLPTDKDSITVIRGRYYLSPIGLFITSYVNFEINED